MIVTSRNGILKEGSYWFWNFTMTLISDKTAVQPGREVHILYVPTCTGPYIGLKILTFI